MTPISWKAIQTSNNTLRIKGSLIVFFNFYLEKNNYSQQSLAEGETFIQTVFKLVLKLVLCPWTWDTLHTFHQTQPRTSIRLRQPFYMQFIKGFTSLLRLKKSWHFVWAHYILLLCLFAFVAYDFVKMLDC
jgi:predicted XRE-type DNA-binding protein